MDELDPQLPAEPRPPLPKATFAQRFFAYLIDVVILNVAGLAVARGVLGLGSIIVNVGIFVAYFTFFEGSSSGQTLGKRALAIRVVDFETGAPIDRTRALARTVGRWVSGLPLLLGYFWMLWDREKQTWHDKIASTAVVAAVQTSPVWGG